MLDKPLYRDGGEIYMWFDPKAEETLRMYEKASESYYHVVWAKKVAPKFLTDDCKMNAMQEGPLFQPPFGEKLKQALHAFRERVLSTEEGKRRIQTLGLGQSYKCSKEEVMSILRSVHPNLKADMVFSTWKDEAWNRVKEYITHDGSQIADKCIYGNPPANKNGLLWLKRSAYLYYQEHGELPPPVAITEVENINELQGMSREDYEQGTIHFEGSTPDDLRAVTLKQHLDKKRQEQRELQMQREMQEQAELNSATPLLQPTEDSEKDGLISEEELCALVEQTWPGWSVVPDDVGRALMEGCGTEEAS